MTEAELDTRLLSMGVTEPPAGIQRCVLEGAGVSAARIAAVLAPGSAAPSSSPPPARATLRTWSVIVGAVAIAAVALFAVQTGPLAVGAADQLVARGTGVTARTLSLRVAVRRSGGTERHAATAHYTAGDTLLFRVHASGPEFVVLRRGAVVLYEGAIPAGVSELPIGYTLERGEGAALFTLEGAGVSDSIQVAGVEP